MKLVNPFILIFLAIFSVKSAPTGQGSLYDAVVADNRTENLRKFPYVNECKNSEQTSKSICFALYDVSLSFREKSQQLNEVNAKYPEDKFCETLQESLPDKPKSNDSLVIFAGVPWLKDTLKQVGKESCDKICFYNETNVSYQYHLLRPVCQFLINQYTTSLETSQDSTPKQVATTAEKSNESLAAEKTPEVTKEIESVAANSTKSNETEKTVEITKVTPEATKPLNSSEPVAKTVNETAKTSSVEQPKPSSIEQPKPPAVETTKPVKSSSVEQQPKPIVQTSQPTESTKDEKKLVESKSDEEEEIPIDLTKTGDEEVNLDNGKDQLPFDEAAEVSETPDKDVDVKADEPFPEGNNYGDDDEEEEDFGTRDNNKLPHEALGEPEQVVDEVQHKKIENVNFEEDPDSNFFTYLCVVMFLCVFFYILHQNRQKVLALCLEGRRGNRRGSRDRTRGGSKAAYSKLDCNLEEAITSKKSMSGKATDIIY